MTKKIAVIGSGLGGLTAAVILARKGCAVTVFERQHCPGGYAVQFQRRGFTFDPSLHSIPAGGKGDTFHSLVDKIGIGDRIQFVKFVDGPEVQFGDRVFQLHNDPERIFDYLIRCFPVEQKNIVRFRKAMTAYSAVYSRVLVDKVPAYRAMPPFLLKLPVFLYQSYESTDHFLRRYFDDPVLRSLLFQYAIFMGIPMDEFPAVNFIIMVSMLLSKGMYTIAGGGGHLTRVLADELKSCGGEILLNTEVTGCVIQNGKAGAVRCTDNSVFETDAVIANVNLADCVRLMPQESVPESYRRQLAQIKPSIAVVQLHIGLDCDVRDTGISRHLCFSFPDSDIDKHVKMQRDSLFPNGFSVTAPGISDPGTYPQNTKVLSVVGGVSADAWFALDDTGYRKKKDECEMYLLEKLYTMYPLLKGHIVVTDCATPRTFHRYTGNPQGALMGFNCTCGMHRQLMALSKFPVRNVYLASAWTDKLGGFMQCMKAGRDAAEKVISRI